MPAQNTLKLSADWDLELTPAGDVALAVPLYATAQDVASAVRTFQSECWYDTAFGMPYLLRILGKMPSLAFLRERFTAVGLTVPGTASIRCFFTGPGIARELGGQLQITNEAGEVVMAETAAVRGILPWYVSGASREASGT